MLENYKILFGIIAAISVVLYSAKYILNDVYSFLKTNSAKARVNDLLPFFSKFNTIFILVAFVFSSLHFYLSFSSSSIFNSGYLTLFLVVFLITVKFFNRKFIDLKQYLVMIPYLLLLSIIVHICFR
ncbi:MAG: hypothetical protein ACRC1Y_03225 [Paraclostridium sp.]